MKKLVFAVGFMAIASSSAGAQNNGNSNGPPTYYYSAESFEALPPTADQGFDPTAHYWDYYRVDPGHGIDADRTTPP